MSRCDWMKKEWQYYADAMTRTGSAKSVIDAVEYGFYAGGLAAIAYASGAPSTPNEVPEVVETGEEFVERAVTVNQEIREFLRAGRTHKPPAGGG